MSENINTAENWDEASNGYATKVAPVLMEDYAKDFLGKLSLNDSMEALEIAAGSGALTGAFSQKVKSLLVTDFSPKMLEENKTIMETKGVSNTQYKVMDGQALDLPDNQFDVVGSSFGVMLFPDRQKGFSEMYRVLKPGGKAMVSGWAGPDKFEGFGLFLGALQKAFPDFPKPDTPPPVFSLANLDDFKNQMEAAGFKNVQTSYVSKDLTVDDFDALWSMFTVGAPPVKVLFDKVGEAGKEKVKAVLADIVKERFGNGPITLSNAATVGVGEK